MLAFLSLNFFDGMLFYRICQQFSFTELEQVLYLGKKGIWIKVIDTFQILKQ